MVHRGHINSQCFYYFLCVHLTPFSFYVMYDFAYGIWVPSFVTFVKWKTDGEHLVSHLVFGELMLLCECGCASVPCCYCHTTSMCMCDLQVWSNVHLFIKTSPKQSFKIMWGCDWCNYLFSKVSVWVRSSYEFSFLKINWFWVLVHSHPRKYLMEDDSLLCFCWSCPQV